MTELNLWLENTGNLPLNLKVRDDITISRLKKDIMARLNIPASGSLDYEILCLRTGTVLRGDTNPVSYLLKDGDHLVLKKTSANTRLDDDNGIEIPEKEVSLQSGTLPGAFSITGIPPFTLDLSSEYPVFAICVKYSFVGITRTSHGRWTTTDARPMGTKPMVSKAALFLIADKNNRFKWEPADQISYFVQNGIVFDPLFNRKCLTRYSLEKEGKESKNMLYPVRPFSITGIALEGFDAKKEYPVLAIDTDQYISQNHNIEDTENEDPQPTNQFLAFFLVGNDTGEFAWIAEDECLLASLKS
jgi:hypothetical protein